MHDIEGFKENQVQPIIEDLMFEVANECPNKPVSSMIKTLESHESKVSLGTIENERLSFCQTLKESSKRKKYLENEEIHFDYEEADMFKFSESISIFRGGGEEREERYSWFFLKEDKQISSKSEGWEWIECKEAELIESAYHEYLKSFTKEKTQYFLNYATYISHEREFEFDFINNLMLLLDNKSIQYKLGRFKGNPNQNKNLPNYLLENNFKWYFSNNDSPHDENFWTPYRIDLNFKIETRFKNFYLNNGVGKLLGEGCEIDFKKFVEKYLVDGKIKKIARFIKCPDNIIRKDYFNNEIEPETCGVNLSVKESITHLKKKSCLIFKNIFPSRFYSKTQKFGFYFKSKSNSIILHLSSGWSFDENDEVNEKYSTSELIEKIRSDGYVLICEIDKYKESTNFFNLNKFPIKMMRSLFKTRWYQRLDEGNKYLWLQFGSQANSEIENVYKKRFLQLNDFDNIEIEDIDLVVNFKKNKIIKEGKVSSIIRLNMKNGFPDKVSIISVAEEIFNKLNYKNERLKLENQLVLYANQFGPKNINELINEIRKEIKAEGYKLSFDDSVQVYDKLYLQKMNNSNFVENIIKIYTEEGFVYKRINKILRDKDYEKLWKMRYFYFSLLYCLEQSQDIKISNTLYRGLSLKPEQESLYRGLKKGNLVVINEFLSTNQDRELASYFAKKGPGSYIIEITVPAKESSTLYLENLSRFPNEREVLIPCGSILKFEEKIEEADHTIIKLNLVDNYCQIYSELLSLHLNNVDLTMIKFKIYELKYLFDSLHKNLQIKQISLKVYEDNMIPYFADKIGKNETLQQITVIRDGLNISNKYIGFSRHLKGSINLKNFSKNEFSLFMLRFLKKAKINYLSLPSFYEESLSNLGKCLVKKDELKKLEISFKSMEVSDNIKYLAGAISINSTLKELNLTNIHLTHEGVIHIGNMIYENHSLEKIMFSIDVSVELDEIARKIRHNKFLKEICISFSSKNLVNKRTIKYDGREVKRRKITLINIYNSKFTSVLSQILLENMDIINLNLSNNDLNRKYSKLLVEIINDCANLSSIDLSNNQLCDNAVQEIFNDLYQIRELREINLENNNITSICCDMIKHNPQVRFKLNYNFIRGQLNQREKTDEYKDNYCIRNLNDHTSYIYSLIELSNGIIASGSYDTTIKLWDSNDNFRCIQTLEGHDDGVYSLLLLADGKLASGSGDHSIRIWDISVNYECVKILRGHTATIYSLLLFGNGLIGSGSRDTKIKIWDTFESFNCIMTLEGHSEAVLCLLFSSLGTIISGSYDNTIRVWDPKMNFECTNILNGHKEGVYSLVSLNDGKIVSGSKDTTIKIWDTFNNYECIHTIQAHADYVYSLVILSDGKLASGSGDFTIKIWDPFSYFKNIETIEGHTDAVICLYVTFEGKLVSGSYDSTIRIWNRHKNFQTFHTLRGHNHYVYCLQQLSDGRIASGSGDNLIKIWDPNFNFNCVQTLKGHIFSVYCIVELNNGDLASGSRDKTIKIWSAQNYFSCSHTIKGYDEAVMCLIVLQDSKLASGSYDSFIKIWDPSNEFKFCQVLEGHNDVVLTFLLLSNGYLLSGSGDHNIKVWNTNSNYKCINTLQGHTDAILSLVLLPDGKVASGSYDKTIRIWNFTKDYRCLKILEGHSNFVLTLLVLSDGHLVSGSGDKSIKIWDSNYIYNCVQTIHGHSEYIYSLIQLSDGSLASGSGDKCIKIWLK